MRLLAGGIYNAILANVKKSVNHCPVDMVQRRPSTFLVVYEPIRRAVSHGVVDVHQT
jgi:hypothetical protein